MRLIERLLWRLALAAGLGFVALLGGSRLVQAATLHHAALLVEHGSGHLVSACVGFVEDQISGLQLIQRSGIEYQAQQFGGLGDAICQLDREPQPVPPGCFGTGPYWQYFHRTASGWTQSAAGAGNWMMHDGAMDGWHYAIGTGQTPPAVTFASICQAAAATASPTSTVRTPPVVARSAIPAQSTAPLTTTSAPRPSISPLVAESLPARATMKPVLAQTGPTTSPPRSAPIGTWLLIGAGTVLLVAIGVINLGRQRR